MDSLQQILQRLARPIDFASRDGYAHLSTVKDLGTFVSRRIVDALAEHVYLPHIETDLLALRQLFTDFDRVGRDEQTRRLGVAQAILARLAGDGARPDKRSVEVWNLPIQFAKGIGPKRAALLARLGVTTVEEALWCLPWRYEDRSIVSPIGQLMPGTEATVCGTVIKALLKRIPRRRLTILEVTVDDGTGSLRAVFFNQPYLEPVLAHDTRVMLSGTVSAGPKGWDDLRMESAQYEVLDRADETPLHVGRIVPIYHETKGMTSRHLRALMRGLLDEYLGSVDDVLPGPVRAKRRLVPIRDALAEVHFPSSTADREQLERGTTPAHRRLAFEEFFLLELALGLRRQSVREEIKGIRFNPATPLLKQLREMLPFRLTSAQERVLAQIKQDMAAPRPMNRLLQGDVGCGKTIVALAAMVVACGSGYQAALMAPTEILAEQHYLTLRGLLSGLGLRAVLIKSGGRTKTRTEALAQLAEGTAQVAIGTHAVIQKDVRFARLGLAVIDEQHKFGVLQRKTLIEKGYHPDVLVVTATPIPRTLAMTVYGDLDVSVIDALPPGRRPIRTLLYADGQRGRAYQILADELRAGRQGYIVYPLVEESEKVDLQAAIQAAERLQAKELKGWRVGLVHGRLKGDEKERTMAAFKAGEIHVLVATTVVEVGVDVANATVMMIEHAERFGLAQLHQLRGRVGRGAHQSYCLLLAGVKDLSSGSEGVRSARRRLEALVRSSDGFVIAEEDLRLRGPGEFFGVRQWGVPEFRAGNLLRDVAMLEEARRDAFALIAADPRLGHPAHAALRAAMLRRWQAKLDLGSVS